MQLIAIEGNRQHLDGGAMFGNAPKEVWQRWILPDERNRIPLACRAFLFRTDEGKNILFEAGIGAFFEPKLKERYGVFEKEHVLLQNLAKYGIKETDINAVIISHLHFDHAGGLLSAYGEQQRLLFPKANYYIGKRHWEIAQAPHIREKASFIPELHRLLKESGRLKFIEDQTIHPLINSRFSDGHTIGLVLSEIRLRDELYVFVSDLIPGAPWVHLPLSMGYDRFPELLVDEKMKFYSEWVKHSTKLLFTHDPVMACGLLKLDDQGKFFVEAADIT